MFNKVALSSYSFLCASIITFFQITKFLKPDKKIVDLVGNEKIKASVNVRHIVTPCSRDSNPTVIPNVIRCYGSSDKVIVFIETKGCASDISKLFPGARALHGDIQQAIRE
ncbi:hypothetical protein MKX01_039318, partial [Papaver californicum]